MPTKATTTSGTCVECGLGRESRCSARFTLHAEVELNPQERDPFYVRLTDFYLQWNKSGTFVMTVGKQGVPFTMDGATSSKELLTIDRSNLTNNIWFPQEYMPGVSVSGRRAPWVYRAGVVLGRRSEPRVRRVQRQACSLLASSATISRNRSASRKRCLPSTTSISTRIHATPSRGNWSTSPRSRSSSRRTRWGVRTDLSGASGYLGQSDLWGVMAMPFVNVTDKLQFVGRYTFLESDDSNGVRLATYENRLVPGRGDRYNELYLGANYYFYGHKLKLQSGIQVGGHERSRQRRRVIFWRVVDNGHSSWLVSPTARSLER